MQTLSLTPLPAILPDQATSLSAITHFSIFKVPSIVHKDVDKSNIPKDVQAKASVSGNAFVDFDGVPPSNGHQHIFFTPIFTSRLTLLPIPILFRLIMKL